MAVNDSYATVAEFKAAIGRADSWVADTARDVTILANLTSISRYIERRVGRHFTQDAAAVARVYMRDSLQNSRILWVDDLAAAPTSVKIDEDNDGSFADETALASTDYELWPLNADKGAEAKPWDRILTTDWGTWSGWPAGLHIQVTAKWGWPAIPQAVKDGVIQLTAILRLESPRATRQIPELGAAIESSREAQQIIGQLIAAYRKVTLF